MNAATNGRSISLECVADFGSLLPWMTQVVQFEIGELRSPAWLEHATPSDEPGYEFTLAALQLSECLLRQFFDESPISVAVFDPAGWLLHTNRALAALLECDAEDLVERNIDEFTHPDDIPAIRERRRMLIDGRCNGFEVETRFATPNRRQIWTRMCGRLERGRGERLPNIIAHIVDVTELKQTRDNFQYYAQNIRLTNNDPDRYI